MQGECCEYLTWDSEFFGFRIARMTAPRLTAEIVVAAERWCRAEAIKCLYFLADSDDPPTIRIAEDHDFRLVDIRLTVAAPVARINVFPAGQAGTVRLCRPEDILSLRRLAGAAHRDSRFYNDPRFPKHLCDALYATWIEKSCAGYADAVFVADTGSGAIGYATAHRDSDAAGRLGVIAVAPESQGLGLGSALTAAVVDWCRRSGLHEFRVVTQGRNIRAQRMYARCGLLPSTLQLWFHRWFSPDEG